MTLLKKISSEYKHALVDKCSEGPCALNLDGIQNYVILKGEKVSEGKTICDFLIFHLREKEIIVGLVESKSKSVRSSRLIKQLENGGIFAVRIINSCSKKHVEPDLFYIALARRFDSNERHVLKGKRINDKMIHLNGCGRTSFKKIITVI